MPPDQAEMIVAALREKGVPHAYLLFAGEQHGFRKAENIRAALDGELSFSTPARSSRFPRPEDVGPAVLAPDVQVAQRSARRRRQRPAPPSHAVGDARRSPRSRRG